MSHCLFLTDHDLRHGFALAGALQEFPDGRGIEERIIGALADKANGLVVLDSRLIDALADERIRARLEKAAPLLSILPPPAGLEMTREDAYALRLIREAIGYQVRLAP